MFQEDIAIKRIIQIKYQSTSFIESLCAVYNYDRPAL